MDKRIILVTGASGFVGGELCRKLVKLRTCKPRAALRKTGTALPAGVQPVIVDELDLATDWASALAGVDVVVHAAGRAHVMKETVSDSLAAFRKVNVDGTLSLAHQASAAGVRRFIFISSIKVNGESTVPGQPFLADDAPAPEDAYGLTKLEAEQGLRQLAQVTDMEVVIVRPVLIYGPGVKANFQKLMRLVVRGVPLPFGSVNNLRSLVSVSNLVDLIVTCIDHPAAANQTFLASDGEDVSLTQLLAELGLVLGRPVRLLSVPLPLLQLAIRGLGRRDLAVRLFGSLQVDIGKNREVLGWVPPQTLEQGLDLTARFFLESRHL